MPQQEHAGGPPLRRASSIESNPDAARRHSLSTRPAGPVAQPSSQRRTSRSSSSSLNRPTSPRANKPSSSSNNGNNSSQQATALSRASKPTAPAAPRGRPAGLHQLPELPEDVGAGLKRALLVIRLAGLALGGYGLYLATKAIQRYKSIYGADGGRSSLLVYYYCMTVAVALHTSLGAYWTILTLVPALRQRVDISLFFGLRPYMFEMGQEFFFAFLWLSLFVSLFFLPRTTSNRKPYYMATLGGSFWSLLPAGVIWRLRVLIVRAEQQLALLPMAVVRVDRAAAAHKFNTIPGAAYAVK